MKSSRSGVSGVNGYGDTYARRVNLLKRTKRKSLAWLVFAFRSRCSTGKRSQSNRLCLKPTRFALITTAGHVQSEGLCVSRKQLWTMIWVIMSRSRPSSKICFSQSTSTSKHKYTNIIQQKDPRFWCRNQRQGACKFKKHAVTRVC